MNVIGIALPKVIAFLSIWIPLYDSNTKIVLTIVCAIKLFWDYDRSRPGHKGLIYKLTYKSKIEMQDFIVGIIGLILSLIFTFVSIVRTAWFPVACGVLSSIFSLVELIGSIKEMQK